MKLWIIQYRYIPYNILSINISLSSIYLMLPAESSLKYDNHVLLTWQNLASHLIWQTSNQAIHNAQQENFQNVANPQTGFYQTILEDLRQKPLTCPSTKRPSWTLAVAKATL